MIFLLKGNEGAGRDEPTPTPPPPPPPLPPPYSNTHPRHPMPQNGEGGEETGLGGKGRTKEGDRTGQTALAENGAERRRRTRKGKTGKNHCGC